MDRGADRDPRPRAVPGPGRLRPQGGWLPSAHRGDEDHLVPIQERGVESRILAVHRRGEVVTSRGQLSPLVEPHQFTPNIVGRRALRDVQLDALATQGLPNGREQSNLDDQCE